MTKRMLIDATHNEETRVAVVENNRLEEFDYESKFRKPLKGNIFLAKVTRVEPSLQAAFVNFGGNRHGFLPFSEIHPDYFRIPIADREALIAEQEEMMAQSEADDEADDADAQNENATDIDSEDAAGDDLVEDAPIDTKDGADSKAKKKPKSKTKAKEKIDDAGATDDEAAPSKEGTDDVEVAGEEAAGEEANEEDGEKKNHRGGRGRGRGRGGRGRRGGRGAPNRSRRSEKYDDDEQSGEQRFRFSLRRKYKIQEVIKRGQIMLVQVSKEERGNKGAAVSSYLSLPGRYCVLMPNSPRGGGVSRKIANGKDRAKMRDMLKNFEIPKGMSVIMRTAGVTRTKAEIKRDLDYLMRLWDNIRELTLQSTAPALVYEEADLIKRAVRDLYTRDIEEVQVSGEDGYKQAKNFMKLMMPSHAKRVVEYKDEKVPLFHKYEVEDRISEIGETEATMKSGGYIVINPTEALVSIDVNSGKATKERHIEETALKTNLEAADEVARQLRLRDLGGLVVIDFIDMEDRRNNAKVERRMRDALSSDRARIQVGRISSFGLMELSRQRMSPSLTEAQYEKCQDCQGTGSVRTADASSVMVVRAIEREGIKGRASQLVVHVPASVALYILNHKRAHIAELEERYSFAISIRVDEGLAASNFRVEVAKPVDGYTPEETTKKPNDAPKRDREDEDGEQNRGRRRGRRGGRGRGRGRDRNQDDSQNENKEQSATVVEEKPAEQLKEEKPKRGGRKAPEIDADQSKSETTEKPKRGRKPKDAPVEAEVEADAKTDKKKPASKRTSSKKTTGKDVVAEKPKKATPKAKSKAASNDSTPKKKVEEQKPAEYETVNAEPDQKKKGWWNRFGE